MIEPFPQITSFTGKYRFLSNFHLCSIRDKLGRVWPSAENAYQAMKSPDKPVQDMFLDLSPAEAKRAGKRVVLVQDWDKIKLVVMLGIVRAKFRQNKALELLLYATQGHELIEGNTWGDTYWGVCNGQGENHLGRILMRVRQELTWGSYPGPATIQWTDKWWFPED